MNSQGTSPCYLRQDIWKGMFKVCFLVLLPLLTASHTSVLGRDATKDLEDAFSKLDKTLAKKEGCSVVCDMEIGNSGIKGCAVRCREEKPLTTPKTTTKSRNTTRLVPNCPHAGTVIDGDLCCPTCSFFAAPSTIPHPSSDSTLHVVHFTWNTALQDKYQFITVGICGEGGSCKGHCTSVTHIHRLLVAETPVASAADLQTTHTWWQDVELPTYCSCVTRGAASYVAPQWLLFTFCLITAMSQQGLKALTASTNWVLPANGCVVMAAYMFSHMVPPSHGRLSSEAWRVPECLLIID